MIRTFSAVSSLHYLLLEEVLLEDGQQLERCSQAVSEDKDGNGDFIILNESMMNVDMLGFDVE